MAPLKKLVTLSKSSASRPGPVDPEWLRSELGCRLAKDTRQIDRAWVDAQVQSLSELLARDPVGARQQIQKHVEELRGSAAADVAKAAAGSDNLLPVMKEALARMATVGEVCDALRGVFGQYRPPETL